MQYAYEHFSYNENFAPEIRPLGTYWAKSTIVSSKPQHQKLLKVYTNILVMSLLKKFKIDVIISMVKGGTYE